MSNIYHEHEGRQVIRVTACLPYSPPPGMSEKQLDVTRERGSTVHTLTEWWDRAELEESSVDVDLEGYLKGWQQLTEDLMPVWSRLEGRVYSKKYDYAGTLDRFGIVGHRLTVLDIKTGPIMPAAALQTAAYEQAIREMNKYRPGTNIYRLSCRLSPEGTYRLKEHTSGEDLYEYLAKLRSLRWDLAHGYQPKTN